MNYVLANGLIVITFVCLSLAVIAWLHKKAPGAKALSAIMVSLAIWSFMYAMRWLTEDPDIIRLWLNLANFGILLAPPSMLVFASQFSNSKFTLSPRVLILFALEPVLSIIFIWTDPGNGFFYGSGYDPNSVLSGGTWFWVNVLYSFILMVFSVIILARYTRSVTNLIRKQTIMILTGYLIPIITCAVEVLLTNDATEFDITPFTFLGSGILVIFSFIRYQLFDITSIGYARLVEISQDALVVLGPDLRIIDMNPAGENLLTPFGAAIGKNAVEVFANWPSILTSLDGAQEAIAFIKINGSVRRDFDLSIIPQTNRNKSIGGWFLLFHDITYLKQTEYALTASENKIRSLFDAITDNVLVLDRDGRYLEIAPTNQGAEIRDPLHLIGKTVHDVFAPNDADAILLTIHQALETGQLTSVDYPMQINEELRWYSGNASPLTADSVIWVARDITERKLVEQSQRENQIRLELAQRISRVGSWELNIIDKSFWASDEYFRIMGINPACGIKTFNDLVKCFSKMKYFSLASSFKNWIKNPIDYEGTQELIRPGESLPVFIHSVASTMKDADGRPYKAAGVIQDITEQKQVEKALEQRLLALTQPLENPGSIEIEDLFNLDDLQKMQDDFARATGVGSLITKPDGTPITRPSNFCRLCGELIRNNSLGAKICAKNDAELCEFIRDHSTVIRCKSIGLLHAGAPIVVGGQHIASWLIGQVRTENFSTEILEEFIERINLDREKALQAFREIPEMDQQQFEEITRSLYTFSSQLSNSAFQNIQQARFITERKKAQEALQNSENKLRSLFRAMTDIIIIYDSEGNYREVAQTNSNLYSHPPEELVNKSIKETLPPELSTRVLDTIQKVLATGEMTLLDYSLNIKGNEHWFSANVSPLTRDSVIWVARDITYRKIVEDRLHYQSMHDTLTGLYNRQYYETEIERLQRSRLYPVSILVMDVDGLKRVNDQFGHSAGDDLLKRVAGLLKSSFRLEDMVARMGGDEFVVILPGADGNTARDALNRLKTDISKHNDLFPADQHLSLSIGSATGDHQELLSEVFKKADHAMYLDKAGKKEQKKPVLDPTH